MKIALFVLFLPLYTMTLGVGIPAESQSGGFNRLYNDALKEEWQVKIQESSGLTLFEELNLEVQNSRNAPEGTKVTELIHNMGNTFCRGFFGTCDENSLYARLSAGCETARKTAMEKMDSNFIRNNTALLKASYTSCHDLAKDVILAHKDAASIGIAKWKGDTIVNSHTEFTEESQTTFQEKVGNTWDVFKKKLTNFVRSIQGITRNVNVRG